jgi:hypothetical protein
VHLTKHAPLTWDQRRRVALLALLGLALTLIMLGLRSAPAPIGSRLAAGTAGDAALYRAIDRRVAAGEPYYRVVVQEQRARNYPLQPFVVVRPPTRTWLFAQIGDAGALCLAWLLAGFVIATLAWRLRTATTSLPLWSASVAVVAASVVPLVNPVVVLWSDLWAGLLTALSLGCRSDRHWRASVAFGFLAVLFRELALAYLAAMTLAALLERRRFEAAVWFGSIALALGLLAVHAVAVHAVLPPNAPVSQGWLRAGGWHFDLSMARATTFLLLLPASVAAVFVPLALFGWAATRGGFARRVTLALAAWLLPGLLIGRPENSYWGLLMAPFWLAGFPLALPALYELVRRPRPITA